MTDKITAPVELTRKEIGVIAGLLLQCSDELLDKVSDDIGYKFLDALQVLDAKEKDLA